ncbi:MAG: hypothetical protein ACE5HC_11395 [Candidatus Binatia bacterium]
MHQKRAYKTILYVLVLVVGFFTTGQTAVAGSESFIEKRSDGVSIIRLTQVPCLFIEAEENPQTYHSTKKADCEKINRETIANRHLKTITLQPGKYIFRVTNKNVPYALGFWLRGQGLGRVTLPSVSGGGLNMGKSKDYAITLVKGNYAFRCPLNPTPDYPLIVR